ncbi:MAG TPA: trehalose-phosphatase [Roseateles sp.]|nr:trehalose-phosphatase [Roseateles sp.]HWT54369.1 trehalose-phosphatase [Rhodocyclaceae bacterium]
MKLTPPPASSEWAYFLDLDGTLVEIADTPGEVHVPIELKTIISLAHRCCNGALAIISGRAIRSLDLLLGLPQLPAAGQHGLEIRDAQGHMHHHAFEHGDLRDIVHHLQHLQARHPGLLLEDKGATLAIHYRQAPGLGSYLSRLLKGVLALHPGLQVQRGKYVFELKPGGFDKGTAVRALATMPPFAGRTPVFIGDDLTDEHGFKTVNQMGGISIKVGNGRTGAQYRLACVEAVRDWLGCMAELAEQR